MVVRSHKKRLPPHKLRYIGYVDDGVHALQCLSCKAEIHIRSMMLHEVKFCLYCGVRWQFGHVTDNRRRELQILTAQHCPPEIRGTMWIVELLDPIFHEWFHDSSDVVCGSAHDAYRHLIRRREWNGTAYFYRVRLASSVQAEDDAKSAMNTEGSLHG